jgi:hypothetical protein
MTTTGNKPDFIRHLYKVKKEFKSYTIYSLVEVTGNKNLLSETIRIETFRSKSNSRNIDDYLRLKTTSNWATSEMVTGLRPTSKNGLFYGDLINKETQKKSLLLFTFSTDREILIIDVFRGFYPLNNGLLKNIIKTH